MIVLVLVFICIIACCSIYIAKLTKYLCSVAATESEMIKNDPIGSLKKRGASTLICSLLTLFLSWQFYIVITSAVDHHVTSGLVVIPLMCLSFIFGIVSIVQSLKNIRVLRGSIVCEDYHFRSSSFLCILGIIFTVIAIALFVNASVMVFTFS